MSNIVTDHVARDWKVSLAAFIVGGAMTSLMGNAGIFLVPFAVGAYISYERLHHHPWRLEDRIVAVLSVSFGCAFGIHFWQKELFQSASEQYWWWLYGVMGKAILSGILGMYAMKYGTILGRKWSAKS